MALAKIINPKTLKKENQKVMGSWVRLLNVLEGLTINEPPPAELVPVKNFNLTRTIKNLDNLLAMFRAAEAERAKKIIVPENKGGIVS
jgi:hypothetical protein